MLDVNGQKPEETEDVDDVAAIGLAVEALMRIPAGHRRNAAVDYLVARFKPVSTFPRGGMLSAAMHVTRGR